MLVVKWFVRRNKRLNLIQRGQLAFALATRTQRMAIQSEMTVGIAGTGPIERRLLTCYSLERVNTDGFGFLESTDSSISIDAHWTGYFVEFKVVGRWSRLFALLSLTCNHHRPSIGRSEWCSQILQ